MDVDRERKGQNEKNGCRERKEGRKEKNVCRERKGEREKTIEWM